MLRKKKYHTSKEKKAAHRLASQCSYNKLGFFLVLFRYETPQLGRFRHRVEILDKKRVRRVQEKAEYGFTILYIVLL
jgi:hypothetical protein